MEHIVGVAVASHNVAIRADRGGPGKGSARIIEAVELAPAQQKRMHDTAECIASDHFTAGVDPGYDREGSAARGVDCGELAIAQQKPMAYRIGGILPAHNIAPPDTQDPRLCGGGEIGH